MSAFLRRLLPLFALFFFALLPAVVSGQVAAPLPDDLFGSDVRSLSSPALCPVSTDYRIDGETDVKVGTSQEYRVSRPSSDSGAAVEISYSLRRGSELIETVTGQEKYLRLFSTPGDAVIEATVRSADGCVATVSKSVRIYRTLVAYVSGDFSWLDEGLAELLVRRSVLVKKIEIASQ
jgi:hypothetical protein